MSPLTLLDLPNEILSLVSTDLRDQGEQESLRKLYSTSKLLHDVVFPDLDHTVYVTYKRPSSNSPILVRTYRGQPVEAVVPPPCLYDSELEEQEEVDDDVDVEEFLASRIMPYQRNAAAGKGPLLRLFQDLTSNNSESLCANTQTLVIQSIHEHVNMVSYCISPDLLGKVLEKFQNLKAISVGHVRIECPKLIAPHYQAAFALNTLQVRWDPLQFCLDSSIRPAKRGAESSLSELFAMFSRIQGLRFVYSMVFFVPDAPAPCEPHGRITVPSIHLVPSNPLPSTARAIILFLQKSLELSAIEELVVDDLCQTFPGDLNNLLSRTENLSKLSLSFHHPLQRKGIIPGHVHIPKLGKLRDLTLDVLVRPDPDPQLEWDTVIKTLQSAATTPVENIVLRFVTRLVPPEDDAERLAWWSRSPADLALDFENATWSSLAWDDLRKVLRGGFRNLRSLRIEYRGPASWSERERVQAQSVLRKTAVTELTVLSPEFSGNI